MIVKFDTIIGDLRESDKGILLEYSTDPGYGEEGQLIINTTEHKIKVWYSSQWQVISTLVGTDRNTGSPTGLLLTLTYS